MVAGAPPLAPQNSHRHPSLSCLWFRAEAVPMHSLLAAFARSLASRCSLVLLPMASYSSLAIGDSLHLADGQSGRTPSGKDRCVHSLF